MDKIILHVDMDAFFASVEVRDNPKLKGKPLIIGSLPNERGVVSTCSYEARKYGVHSAMNIKEAYRLCPNGIYMHPNYEKYQKVSNDIHKIWDSYATASEAIALDEAYLDITDKAKTIEGARIIAKTIKERIRNEIGLSCSVGLAYSKIAAKTASEEKKPNGYYEILTETDFVNLMIDREVGELYTVGKKSQEKLNQKGIYTIRDIHNNPQKVIELFGKRGEMIIELAHGRDDRELKEYNPKDTKSISREITFQKDVENIELIKDVMLLLSICVEHHLKEYHFHASGVSIKITYYNMKTITRSKIVYSSDTAIEIYKEALKLLNQIEQDSIRLIGVGVYNITTNRIKQLSFEDLKKEEDIEQNPLELELKILENKYHLDFINNIEKIYHMRTLYRVIEYMRKYCKRV